MFRDRLAPFGVVADHIRIVPELQGGDPQNFAVNLQQVLLREAPEHADEGDLVGETSRLWARRRCAISRQSFSRKLP